MRTRKRIRVIREFDEFTKDVLNLGTLITMKVWIGQAAYQSKQTIGEALVKVLKSQGYEANLEDARLFGTKAIIEVRVLADLDLLTLSKLLPVRSSGGERVDIQFSINNEEGGFTAQWNSANGIYDAVID